MAYSFNGRKISYSQHEQTDPADGQQTLPQSHEILLQWRGRSTVGEYTRPVCRVI